MSTIIFEVLGTPTGKGRPRACVRGTHAGVYADSKTVSAERSLLAQALPYKPATPLEGPLMVTIEAFCAIPKSFTKAQRAGAISQALRPTGKPDVDNLAKLVLDALNGVFFADDKQVTMLIVSKRYTDGAARTGIKITEL